MTDDLDATIREYRPRVDPEVLLLVERAVRRVREDNVRDRADIETLQRGHTELWKQVNELRDAAARMAGTLEKMGHSAPELPQSESNANEARTRLYYAAAGLLGVLTIAVGSYFGMS